MQCEGISLRRIGGANDQESQKDGEEDLPSQADCPQNGRLKGKLVGKVHKICDYLRGADQ